MFYLMILRVVKVARVAGAYQASSTNVKTWHVTGPFSKLEIAEKAALMATGTHSCLAAEIVSPEVLLKMSEASSFDSDVPPDMRDCARHYSTRHGLNKPVVA